MLYNTLLLIVMYYAMSYVMATSGFCMKRVKRSNKRDKRKKEEVIDIWR